MAYFTVPEVQAWLETTKLTLPGPLDGELAESVIARVLGIAARSYDVSAWDDTASTPDLILKVMAMLYAGEFYNRQYSEDYDGSSYGDGLIARAMLLLAGIVDGSIDLIEVVTPASTAAGPSFYPNDVSTAQCPTSDDSSLGPPVFSMGRIW